MCGEGYVHEAPLFPLGSAPVSEALPQHYLLVATTKPFLVSCSLECFMSAWTFALHWSLLHPHTPPLESTPVLLVPLQTKPPFYKYGILLKHTTKYNSIQHILFPDNTTNWIWYSSPADQSLRSSLGQNLVQCSLMRLSTLCPTTPLLAVDGDYMRVWLKTML